MSFRVVTDSCCDMLRGIIKVPLTIRVGDHTFTDNEKLDQSDLLWAMKNCPEAPKTACPSPTQYMEAYGDGTDDVYVVTLSALLSGSHNVAQQGAMLWLEEHPEGHIRVFNSCSASAGEALIALKIKEIASTDLPFEEVVSQIDKFCGEMNTLFVLESLDNLRKNGRLTALQSIVTSTLKIKLLMGATPEGEICKKSQALSVKQALSKMTAIMAADEKHAGKILSISHCNCLERAFLLREMAQKQCHFSQTVIFDTCGISTVYANDGGIVAAY
ncbi:MAG: DegV family protein [Oscillospiraceae bacterium]